MGSCDPVSRHGAHTVAGNGVSGITFFFFKCCFSSTEIIRTVRDKGPTTTGRLDIHTAPELWGRSVLFDLMIRIANTQQDTVWQWGIISFSPLHRGLHWGTGVHIRQNVKPLCYFYLPQVKLVMGPINRKRLGYDSVHEQRYFDEK